MHTVEVAGRTASPLHTAEAGGGPRKHAQACALVIDDDASFRLLVEQALLRADIRVAQSSSAEDAVSRFEEIAPDVVLLDVTMPGMDGFEACRALRGLPGGADVPIVMITGLEDVESVDAAYDAGATAFITKPIHWPVLGHRVRYLLRGSQLREELRASEARNRALLAAIPDAIFLVSPEGTVVEQVGTGHADGGFDDLDGKQLNEVVDAESAARLLECVRRTLEQATTQNFEFSTLRNGRARHFEARMVVYAPGLVLAIVRDMTARRAAEARARRLASHDLLTGLPNRQSFRSRCERAIAVAAKSAHTMAVLHIDLDNFKRINESLGHSVGDALLKTVAERLDHSVRGSDYIARVGVTQTHQTVARLGGDEFVLLLGIVHGRDEVASIAERVRQTLVQPIAVDGQEFVVTPSIGIAVFPEDGRDPEALLKHADAAMFQAKTAGKNRYRFSSEQLAERSVVTLDLENALRRAIAMGELELHYQPKIAVDSGQVVGAEALVRWTDPVRGAVSPGVFVPVAEQCGLIHELGEWVLREACRQASVWDGRPDGGVPIAVNVSSQQFLSGDLAQTVLGVMSAAGVQAELIDIELTESTLMSDEDATVAALRALKAEGLRIAVDDFGTGYSSLSYLKRFPLDALKIDRSFVMDLCRDTDDEAICKAIIAMAHSLGLTVIAEGVETHGQLQFLRAHDCDQFQGYLISRPVPPDEFESAFLR